MVVGNALQFLGTLTYLPFTVKELDESGKVTATWNFLVNPPNLPGRGESSDHMTMMTDMPEEVTKVSEMGSYPPNIEVGFPERCTHTM